jgi:hypothetical protein
VKTFPTLHHFPRIAVERGELVDGKEKSSKEKSSKEEKALSRKLL